MAWQICRSLLSMKKYKDKNIIDLLKENDGNLLEVEIDKKKFWKFGILHGDMIWKINLLILLLI